MANGRLWLQCQKCGERKLVLKYWVSHVTAWSEEELEEWTFKHLLDCHGLPRDLSNQGDLPLFILEGE